MSSMSSGSERSNEICPDDPHCDSRLSTSSFRSTGDECWPSGTVKIWLSEATRHLWDDAWHTTFATSITLRLCELCTKPKEDTLILFAIDVTSWDLQIDSVSQSSTSQSVNYPTQSMSKSRKKERHFRVLWFQTDTATQWITLLLVLHPLLSELTTDVVWTDEQVITEVIYYRNGRIKMEK